MVRANPTRCERCRVVYDENVADECPRCEQADEPDEIDLGDLVLTSDEDATVADTLEQLADHADHASPLTVERVCRACAAVLREDEEPPTKEQLTDALSEEREKAVALREAIAAYCETDISEDRLKQLARLAGVGDTECSIHGHPGSAYADPEECEMCRSAAEYGDAYVVRRVRESGGGES